MIPKFRPLLCLLALAGFNAPIIAIASNALERWRPQFEILQTIDPALRHELAEVCSPLNIREMDTALAGALRLIEPQIERFVLLPDESLEFPPIHGPETPFPDHAPLAEIARIRLALIKLAWADGNPKHAISLAMENLILARATLKAQQGIVPVINAISIWQTALDGIYWLARQPTLSANDAATLQSQLANDHDLAARSLMRAFQGEYTFVQKVIIERLPVTNDPELILDAIGSFGMSPPTAPPEGELRLPIIEHILFDPAATLAGALTDVEHYNTALTSEPARFPRSLPATLLWPVGTARTEELGVFLRYAITDDPVTPESVSSAAKVLAQVENPLGKLYLLLAIPNWNAVAETVYRRQAQNNALQGLLAWRRLGHTADWDELIANQLLDSAPTDPFSNDNLLIDPQRAVIWSVGLNATNEGGTGDGENLGRPDDFTWPWLASVSGSE